MYRKLTNPKHRLPLMVLTLFVLLSFTLTSCVTYYTKDITPQEFESISSPELETVTKIVTKDSVIDTSPYKVWYKRAESSLILEKIDSILVKNTVTNGYKLKKSLTELKLSDVYKITTENSKISVGKTMMWTGIVAGTILVIALIAALISPPKMNVNMKFN